MKREEFEKFSQLVEKNLNNMEFADIDIEEKFNRIMNVLRCSICAMLLLILCRMKN